MHAKPATTETEAIDASSVAALVAAFGRLALAVECMPTWIFSLVIFLMSLIALVATSAARNATDSANSPAGEPEGQTGATVPDTTSTAPSRGAGNVAVAVALSGVNTSSNALLRAPATSLAAEGPVSGGTTAGTPPAVNTPTLTVMPPAVNTAPLGAQDTAAAPVVSNGSIPGGPMTPTQLAEYVNALPDEGRWYLVIRGTEPGIYTSW